MLDFVGNSEQFNEGFERSVKRASTAEEGGKKQDERAEREQEIQTAENKDAWIWREWLEIEPGGEVVDLNDMAPEIEKIGLGLIKAHPTYERIESGVSSGRICAASWPT